MYQIEGVTKSARRQRRERLLVDGILEDSAKIEIEAAAEPHSASKETIVETQVQQDIPPHSHTNVQEDTQQTLNSEQNTASVPNNEAPVIETTHPDQDSLVQETVKESTQQTSSSEQNPSSTPKNEEPVIETSHKDQDSLDAESLYMAPGTQPSVFWFLVLLLMGSGFISGAIYFFKHLLHP